MTFQNTTLSNELYTIANGSTSSIPFVDVFMSRDPTPNDTQYAVQKKWLNTTTNNLWMLKGFTPAGGIVHAIWINFGASAIESFAVDASTPPGTNPVLPTPTGLVTITGGQVAAGTTANVIRTDSLAANTYTIEIQRSQAAAVSTLADNGVSHFNSAEFTVDANGFVSLVGGGSAIEAVNVQTGTSPIVPLAGAITINGALVAAGTHPVRSDGTGANTLAIEVQTAQAIASTNATNVGLAAFNSAEFTVDANGFVSLVGGGAAIETITGNTGGPEVPLAGNFNIVGTGSITVAGSANTETVQLTGLTAHNVLLGEGTATIGLVAPSSTSGIPLISQGAAADPIFGTAVVAGGGTGNTTFTPYAVITAGTTATGAFQNVLGLGTAGQVLTSSGAGALPTWQSGGSVLTITTVNHAQSPYTVLSTDQFLAVNVSGGVVTLLLPNTTTTGRVIHVKDSTGGAATSNITVTTVGGAVTIDGLTSYIMNSNYQAISLIFDGTNYEVF